MLVITRKTSEIIRISDKIIIKVLYLANGRVSIGVDAPKSVPIIRGEVKDLRERPNNAGPLSNRIVAVRQRDGSRMTYPIKKSEAFGEGVF